MNAGKFIFFWLPYPAKYSYHTFLTAYYVALNKFPVDKAIHIGTPQLLNALNPHFEYNGIGCPPMDTLKRVEKVYFDSHVFQKLENEKLTNHFTWASLMTERNEAIENEIRPIIEKLVAKNNILGIVAWCNTPSLKAVAEEFGLKVIHNEMGPLRNPYYTHTAYFDFSGVNGNTECQKRFNSSFETIKEDVPVLSTGQILNLFGENPYMDEISRPVSPEVHFGIPLQVEDDSNMLAYGRGFNNYELISWARNTQEKFLVRKHPAGHVDYREINDHSATPIEFIKRSSVIVTINSSVGLEARLYSRKAVYLGDSPFKFLSTDFLTGTEPENLIEKINYAVFGYLIPFDYLYDYEYFSWRLTNPSERKIYETNLGYYLKKKELL